MHFAHRRLERPAQVGIGAHRADRLPRAAVMPDNADRNTNFIHNAWRMSATISASMPAPLHASSNASAAARWAGATAPKRSRAIVPVCAMTPGSADRRRDVGDAARSLRSAPTTRADALDALDAVLERDHDAARREQRLDRSRPPDSVSHSLTRTGRRRTSRASPGRRSTDGRSSTNVAAARSRR